MGWFRSATDVVAVRLGWADRTDVGRGEDFVENIETDGTIDVYGTGKMDVDGVVGE